MARECGTPSRNCIIGVTLRTPVFMCRMYVTNVHAGGNTGLVLNSSLNLKLISETDICHNKQNDSRWLNEILLDVAPFLVSGEHISYEQFPVHQ